MSAWAILAAAGEGSRLGRGPKGFLPLGGVPMMAHSLVVLAKAASIEGIVAVVPASHIDEARSLVAATVPNARVVVAPGGPTRQASVRAGMAAVPAEASEIVVHDAARPLVTVAMVEAALEALTDAAASAVCIPVSDTLKRVEGDLIVSTMPRAGFWRAQTPQAFRAAVLREAHGRAADEGVEATDDAALVELLGHEIAVVLGDERNVKVTTPAELAVAEALLRAQRSGE